MLAMPERMATDHFNAPCTPMLKFWIRGASVGFLTSAVCLAQMSTELAAPICAVSSFGIALLCPFNAKWSLFDEKLPVKYPMHYVPEVLMGALTLAGAYINMM